jgi:hypothetical protein
MTAGSAVGYREYLMMEVADSVPENKEEYDSDEDEDGSLASFCAYMSQTSNSSLQETVLMKEETGDRRKRMSARKGTGRETSLFHDHCDTEKNDDGSLSVNTKKVCIVCDVIV